MRDVLSGLTLQTNCLQFQKLIPNINIIGNIHDTMCIQRLYTSF